MTLLLSLIPTYGSAAAAPVPAGAEPAPGTAARIITLITGDRVAVLGQNVSVEPGQGRAGASFLIRRVEGEQHVVPTDALPLLRSGRLDPRLFNITTLLEFGYDNRPEGLPLIVTGSGLSRAALPGTRHLPAANAVAANAGTGQAFWKSLTATDARHTKVWLDGQRQLLLDTSVPLVGAPAAWQAGYDGTGVKVAVLDTGVDATHPDLAGRVVAERNFTPIGATDTVGHGTHVASTVAGSGAASGGRYRGVASGAQVLAGKICLGRTCPDSLILEGLQWAAEQGADVVNLSLGSPDTPGVDPVEEAVANLTERYGMLVVAAAGNLGAYSHVFRIDSPGSADAALSVAATTKTDEFADFSSHGPRPGDLAVKPDISAPGLSIVAARGKDMRPIRPDEKYVTFTGTSMSAPHVAGAAAILAQQHPDWTPGRLKAALMGSATPLPGTKVTRQGAGRLDVARAVSQKVVAEPPSVSFGEQLWPHDGPAVPKPVTYVNHGPDPVTLSLAAEATGPDGKPVPAAAFTASPSTVTVPAGGQVVVNLLADTKALGAVYGYVSGYLRATAGDTVVTTPFGLENEQESYNLTIAHLDREGAPAAGFADTVFRMDQPGVFGTTGPGDTVRVPKGVYTVYATIGDGPDNLNTLLVRPRLEVGSTQTMVADARLAQPVVVTPPRADLRWQSAMVGAAFADANRAYNFLLQTPSFDGISVGRIGPDQPLEGLRSIVRGTVVLPGPDGTEADSPEVYHLAWPVERHAITGFTRHVKHSDLATVRTSRAVNATGNIGRVAAFPLTAQGPVGSLGNSAPSLAIRLPFHRTEYFTTEGGVRWQSTLLELGPDFRVVNILDSAPTAYRAGRTYTDRWNYAVLGPTLPREARPMVFRTGDTLRIDAALSGDASGKYGVSLLDRAVTTLYRNGERFGQSPFAQTNFEVPPEPADYRLEITSQRVIGELSTRVNVAWTFRSGHVDGDRPGLLPLWAVRYSPSVDDHGTAPAGRRKIVPVTVESQPGGDAGRLRTLAVQVSFDDGQTWQDAPLFWAHFRGVLLVRHPAADGFVSLRATAEDSKGNTLSQTIIRAYRIAAQP